MSDERLRMMLYMHEGERLIVYDDANPKAVIKPGYVVRGNLTIGVGRNLMGRGITSAESSQLLENDIEAVRSDLLSALPWIEKLDEVRQAVLIDMCFNMGLGSRASGKGLLGFQRTLSLISTRQFDKAAESMLASRWAKQVGSRANRLAKMMLTGVWYSDSEVAS